MLEFIHEIKYKLNIKGYKMDRVKKQETTKVEEKKAPVKEKKVVNKVAKKDKDKEVVVKSKVKLNKPKKQNLEANKNTRSAILELGAGL